MADMENGLYSGVNAGYNANDPTTDYHFTTAMIEGGANQWAILGGNAHGRQARHVRDRVLGRPRAPVRMTWPDGAQTRLTDG
jgi:hypothetical protein